MEIPLKSFEQFVDDRILARGWHYFEGGAVIDVLLTGIGCYEAIVSGSEDYTVILEVKKDTIVSHNCNCPYDMGPICKHIVAVIFYLQKDTLDNSLPNTKTLKKKKTIPLTEQVNTLLKKIPHTDLIAFVTEQTKKDKKFRNYFLASFAHLGQDKSKKAYQKQIQAILNAASGRDGWIDWDGMKYVVNATQPFIDNAEKYLEQGDFEHVFSISTAMLEEMTKAFDYADDSNGDLGSIVEEALELLYGLIQKKLPNVLKQEIFDYCLVSFNKKIFEGWDLHLGILGLAVNMVDKESNVDRILECLASVDGRYEMEQAQNMTLDVLKRFKDKATLDAFVDKHISNPAIRTKEIELAYRSKNFERAVALAEDGIKCDHKDKPGLVKNWYNWLLKVAQQKKDTSKIITYARYLFINNFNPEQDYYRILKETVPDAEWHNFLETIIAEVTPKTRWTYSILVRTIYIKEAWWDRLFLLLKQNCSLENIEQNEIYLNKDYAPELVQLYRERVVNYVDKYVGRSHYQKACRYLRRMKKLGGREQVDALTIFFREKYPQRKALMDELSRV